MKKLIQLACIGIILIVASCKDQGDEFNPLPLLSVLGNSTLTVTAAYNGTLATGTDPADGSGKIFVYLYRSLGALNTRDPEPVYKGSTESAVSSGIPSTITINHIRDGEYYMLVFYDYAGGGKNDDNYQDRYVLYSGTGYTSGASKLVISGENSVDIGTFGNDYELGDGSVYESTATYTLTVNATYTGTLSADALATKLIHVYLYGSLGTSTRNPVLPVKTATSSLVAESGVEQAINVTGVAPGNYYVLVFYDSSAGTEADSQGDPYTFFTNTPYTGNAQQIVMSAADRILPDIAFGETNTLQADGSYLTTSDTVDFIVTTQYTGSEPTSNIGSRRIFVYLYSVLGTGTRNQYLRIYEGSTPSAVTLSTPYDVSIAGVIPGDYYILAFYDFRSATTVPPYDNQQDRYVLYNGVRYIGDATPFSISSGSNSVTLDINQNTWLLQNQSLFMVP